MCHTLPKGLALCLAPHSLNEAEAERIMFTCWVEGTSRCHNIKDVARPLFTSSSYIYSNDGDLKAEQKGVFSSTFLAGKGAWELRATDEAGVDKTVVVSLAPLKGSLKLLCIEAHTMGPCELTQRRL